MFLHKRTGNHFRHSCGEKVVYLKNKFSLRVHTFILSFNSISKVSTTSNSDVSVGLHFKVVCYKKNMKGEEQTAIEGS